jgi:hypothetical protein
LYDAGVDLSRSSGVECGSSAPMPNGTVVSVIPGDFNRDGCLDLLLQLIYVNNNTQYPYHPPHLITLQLYLGDHRRLEYTPVWQSLAADQVLVFDGNADLHLDLFGAIISRNGQLMDKAIWVNDRTSRPSFVRELPYYLGMF